MPSKYRGKVFNENVFERYLKTLESTKENALINNALFTVVNKYKSKMSEQAGGYFVTEPIKGRIGGTPVNYDGNTDITSNERDTYYQTKICFGRANAWGEYDFTSEITGENFMAEAQEVKEYWDEIKQGVVLDILSGIFSMSDTAGAAFVDKHTYEVKGNLSADALNKASQKALGDKKAKLEVMYTHSAVSTNLEGLNLIDFLKYTDADGIERDLTIGTYNGKLVIVDDDMPAVESYEASTDTTVQAGKTYYTRSGDASTGYTYTAVENPSGNPSSKSYYEQYTAYTSYVFKNGFFEFEDLGVKVPTELARDAKTKGGQTDLISRVRYMIVPTLISYTKTTNVSPTNSEFANGANWELVNNGETGVDKKYVDDKLIPVVRIISRG